MVKNVNRTARLQWKVDTIKNCIYLQCGVVILVSEPDAMLSMCNLFRKFCQHVLVNLLTSIGKLV